MLDVNVTSMMLLSPPHQYLMLSFPAMTFTISLCFHLSCSKKASLHFLKLLLPFVRLILPFTCRFSSEKMMLTQRINVLAHDLATQCQVTPVRVDPVMTKESSVIKRELEQRMNMEDPSRFRGEGKPTSDCR